MAGLVADSNNKDGILKANEKKNYAKLTIASILVRPESVLISKHLKF